MGVFPWFGVGLGVLESESDLGDGDAARGDGKGEKIVLQGARVDGETAADAAVADGGGEADGGFRASPESAVLDGDLPGVSKSYRQLSKRH